MTGSDGCLDHSWVYFLDQLLRKHGMTEHVHYLANTRRSMLVQCSLAQHCNNIGWTSHVFWDSHVSPVGCQHCCNTRPVKISSHPAEGKIQYLLTCKVSRYCLLSLHGSTRHHWWHNCCLLTSSLLILFIMSVTKLVCQFYVTFCSFQWNQYASFNSR